MADQFMIYDKQGWDVETKQLYGIIVSPEEEEEEYYYNSNSDSDSESDAHRMHMDYKYEFLKASGEGLYPYSTYDVFAYDVHLSGDLVGHQEDLIQRLEFIGISLAARNDIVRLIFNHPSSRLGIASLHVRIDIMYDEDETDDEEDEQGEEMIDDRDLQASMTDPSRPTPVSREAVGALEKVTIRAVLERETSCAVCLEGFSIGSEVTKMPCSHAFHGECIVRWLEYQCVCPLCRFELPCAVETFEDMESSDFA